MLVEIGGQPVERPAGKGQSQCFRLGQRGSDHRGHLLGRIGRRATAARMVLQRTEALGIEAVDAPAHCIAIKPQCGRNRGRRLSLAGLPQDLGAFDGLRWCGSRMGQFLEPRPLFWRQLTHMQGHRAPPRIGGRQYTASLPG